MSKAKFAEAKKLIDAKRYVEARALLEEIDHPTAREWLAKLDKITPEKRKRKAKPAAKGRSNRRRDGLLILIGVIIVAAIFNQPSSRNSSRQTAATARPTTANVQRAATAVNTIAPTRIPPSQEPELVSEMSATTLYAQGAVNVRSCPETSCERVGTMENGSTAITDGVVDGEGVNAGNRTWYRVTFNGQLGYVYSAYVSFTAPMSANSPQQSVSQPPAASGFTCPSNCDGAKAMGLSAEQAAACGLDRDGDGVACYGD